ncbi:MAG TPA: undecaprenyl-diphosphate phosphatase [Patescibacteria group bacterium]|nr:undecaprenyl-diphosphate phosphatase [Patescibacteria group bacterium]
MLFDIFKAIVLGMVEGVTEFLPISSTGHLIIVNQWFFWGDDFTRMFDIVIQGGAILAVIIYFRKHLFLCGEHKNEVSHIWFKVLLATVPALIIGVIIGDSVQKILFHPLVVAVALIIGGIALIWIEKKERLHSGDSIRTLTYKTVICIGIIQCLAFIPGVSRSAATILGALMLGVGRKVATEFSFFLAIPTLLAAGVYSLFKNGMSLNSYEAVLLILGCSASFFSAWLVTGILMKYITTHNFEKFGYYRIGLGVMIIGLLLLRVIK